MEHESMRLYNHSAVLNSGLANFDANAKDMAQALQQQLGIPIFHLRVMRHWSEDFFAFFDFSEHRDAVVKAGSVRVNGVEFAIQAWSADRGAELQNWWYRARICIENLSLPAWTKAATQKVLGDICVVDHVKEGCKN